MMMWVQLLLHELPLPQLKRSMAWWHWQGHWKGQEESTAGSHFLFSFTLLSHQIKCYGQSLPPMGNADTWHHKAKSEEWLWSWEKSLKSTHLHSRNGDKMLQKYSLRRTRFEGGTSIPFCSRFQVEEGEIEFHSPSVSHPSLREELSLLWWMNLAEGNRTDRTIPGTSRYMCPLGEFPASSEGEFTKTGKASAGGSSLCGSPVTEWMGLL